MDNKAALYNIVSQYDSNDEIKSQKLYVTGKIVNVVTITLNARKRAKIYVGIEYL